MKLTFAILLLIGLTFNTNAQKKELLVGKWQFEDFTEIQELDSIGLMLKEMIFKEMTFSFSVNGRYQSMDQTGNWRLNEDENELILTTDKGYEDSNRILKLSKDMLELQIGDAGIIFSKMTTKQEDSFAENPVKLQTMSASVEGISRKWYLQKKDTKVTNEEHIMLLKELWNDSYIKFSKKGRYKARIAGNKVNSKWTFGEENKSIIIPLQSLGKMIWNIHKISENELVLIKGVSEKWYFSTKKTK